MNTREFKRLHAAVHARMAKSYFYNRQCIYRLGNALEACPEVGQESVNGEIMLKAFAGNKVKVNDVPETIWEDSTQTTAIDPPLC